MQSSLYKKFNFKPNSYHKMQIIAIFAQKYQNNTILLFHKGGKPCSVSFCYYNKLDLLCSNYINLHKAHEIGH